MGIQTNYPIRIEETGLVIKLANCEVNDRQFILETAYNLFLIPLFIDTEVSSNIDTIEYKKETTITIYNAVFENCIENVENRLNKLIKEIQVKGIICDIRH